MQTKGVRWPMWRWDCSNSGPRKTKPVWLFTDHVHAVWLGVSWSSLCGHWIGHHGHLASLCWACMVELWMIAALESFKQNKNNYMGDLGIEPRSQYLQATSFANWAIQRFCNINEQQILYKKNNHYGNQTK